MLLDSKKNKTAVLFTFQWLRFVSSIPFFAKLLEFSKHFTPPPLPPVEAPPPPPEIVVDENIELARTLTSTQMRSLVAE